MNITLKEMKLTFIVDVDNLLLERKITNMNGDIIWTSGMVDSTEVDTSPEGLDAYEIQMKAIPAWNIVQVERVYV